MSASPARFRLDVAYLATVLLPALLRKPRLVAWVSALTSPVDAVYQAFLAYRLDTLRELSYNGQTALLEKALNDKLDPNLRRILIRNSTVYLDPLYLNFKREAQPPVYASTRAEGRPLLPHRASDFAGQVGFTVYAPGLNAKDYQLNILLQRFKIALVSYRIIYAPAPN
ncbi:hypothetical protein [Hymenobacter nivis]|uniref:Uncharacterized protein n=1 Tax=Hymenobacter nivis TaxID=1850093 RepID=A0A2Z3GGU0_9BACT|nr:hypothetical protein [Hymenobacter nivis]AWM31371.1 hypothetical protein DDQ68_00350 [Hymenobacter nivis]